MNEQMSIMSSILNNINYPIVFVDSEHIIRYMNRVALENPRWTKHGNLIGRSIFDCHNEKSKEIILNFFKQLETGEREIRFENSSNRRIYMTGVFDSNNKLIGYFERYEYWD